MDQSLAAAVSGLNALVADYTTLRSAGVPTGDAFAILAAIIQDATASGGTRRLAVMAAAAVVSRAEGAWAQPADGAPIGGSGFIHTTFHAAAAVEGFAAVLGVLGAWRRQFNPQGREIAVGELHADGQVVPFVIHPDPFKRVGGLLQEGEPITMFGRATRVGGQARFIVYGIVDPPR